MELTLSYNQKRLISSLVIFLIAIGLFIGLIIYPLISSIRSASGKYLANQNILAGLERREFFTKEMEEEYQKNQADLAKIEEAFLDSEKTVGFISTLEVIAEETGNVFEIKTAKSSSPDEEEPFFVLQISLWGDFLSLLKFVASLENSPYPPYRLMETEDIAIRRLVGRDPSLKKGDLETILSIKIYTQ